MTCSYHASNRVVPRPCVRVTVRDVVLVKIPRRRQPDVPLTGAEQSVELAPSPVVVGYSLVGVYPCAVWKPRCSSCNNNNNNNSNSQPGPVRSRVANTARPHPYLQHQHQQQQVFTQNSAATTANTAAAGVQQTPQLLVTACSCREGVGTATAEFMPQAATVGTTPMIFVPFTVPSFVNGCSPSSKVRKIILILFFA